MPPDPSHDGAAGARQASDVMAFGQEVGRAVKRAVGVIAAGVLEDIALDARLDDHGRLVAETNVRRIAENPGVGQGRGEHLSHA